jgi:monodictyphenone polyketide synthase
MLDSEKLKLYHFPNEFPTNDAGALIRQFRRQSKHKGHLYLRLFLNDATVTLRDELRSLPDQLKATLPPFESILDLAELPDLRKLPFGSAIEALILLVVQLGVTIG